MEMSLIATASRYGTTFLLTHPLPHGTVKNNPLGPTLLLKLNVVLFLTPLKSLYGFGGFYYIGGYTIIVYSFLCDIETIQIAHNDVFHRHAKHI